MKDLYIENYRRLQKKIKKDTNTWEDILCPWIEGIMEDQQMVLRKLYISTYNRTKMDPYFTPYTKTNSK